MNLERDQKVFLAFILVSGLILFWNLWGRSLENHGYIRYAEIAREMIRSGDWVVPRLNGEIFIDKPPLLFWLIAIPSYFYGSVTPLIARLPSALSAWIGVVVLFLWAKKVYGTTLSGLLAGGALLSSYQYFTQARLAKTDIVLCLFIILALYFFHLGYSEARKGWRFTFYGFSFFSIGVSTLTKGPFGLFIPLMIIFVFLIKERRWKIFLSGEFLLGCGILVMAVLPWVLLFIDRIGWEEYITLLIENKILTRRAPFYFYFIEIWGQFFPWSIVIPYLSFYVWRRRDKIWNSDASLFIIWFAVLFIILTLFKFKASRYMLPALPPLVLLLGGMWKKKLAIFLALFLLAVSVWHGREMIWIKKDLAYSPGMVLVRELQPFLKEKALYTYRLDDSTLEEINFYLDPVAPTPVLKEIEHLDLSKGKGKIAILMSGESYEKVQSYHRGPASSVEYPYKGGKMVLAFY